MKLKEAAKKVEDGIDETLTYYHFPSEYWSRIRTNNAIERLNREIRRRTRVGVGVGTVSAGIAAVSFVSTVAIPAVTAFGVALNTALGPIGWVALGIGAVIAAGAAFIAMMGSAEDETADMTAVTRNQYYELQDLNAEYEEACEKYGETSEEASRLKYQVDDLSTSFEANRQTVEKFTAEVDALCESVDKLWTE